MLRLKIAAIKNRDKYSILRVKIMINIIMLYVLRAKFIFNSILRKECHSFNIVNFSWEGEDREIYRHRLYPRALELEHTS